MPKVIENYLLETLLGSGQYGKVYKAKNIETSEYFAVKSIKTAHLQKMRLENTIQNELTILKSISSPHIVKFLELKQTPTHYYMIYEYCNGGTLEGHLRTVPTLSENEALSIFGQIVEALRVLGNRGVVHRDLKPSNILFHNGVLKVADFGFARILKKPTEMMETMVGSPLYMAPEILQGKAYDKKSDIWSLGVILYQLIFGRVPFEENSLPALIKKTGNFEKSELFRDKKPSKIVDLLAKMLENDPIKRIDWDEFFQNSQELGENKENKKCSNALQFFNMERIKIQYLYEILEEMLKMRLSDDLEVYFVLMNKIWVSAKNVKESINLAREKETRNSENIEIWARIFNMEFEKIDRNCKSFHEEMKSKKQGNYQGYDEILCQKKLLEYCNFIKEKSLERGIDTNSERKILTHLNMVLEVINLHEFARNYFEFGKSLRNQRYFEILRSYEIESLKNVTTNKLSLYKSKLRKY